MEIEDVEITFGERPTTELTCSTRTNCDLAALGNVSSIFFAGGFKVDMFLCLTVRGVECRAARKC